MNLNISYYRLVICPSLFICSNLFFSCYKEEKTIAIITVLDNNTNNPIPDARVRLFYDNFNGLNVPIIDEEKITSSNGSASFDFSENYQDGQAGFAVLDVEVNGDYMGVINIVEMSTTEKIVFIP